MEVRPMRDNSEEQRKQQEKEKRDLLEQYQKSRRDKTAKGTHDDPRQDENAIQDVKKSFPPRRRNNGD
jgi:hypothetical protein